MKEPIPQQSEGASSNTFHTKQCSSIEEARQIFEEAKKRLLNVNEWKELAGVASAEFQLTDDAGNEVNRNVKEGDHFKIDIPAPGNKSGDGYDWVKVERISEEHEPDGDAIFIQVRPAENPTNEDSDIAHFFGEDATSTFSVKRINTEVTASVHGRNEKPNTDTESLIDKARNAIISVTAMSGFSKLQWSQLVRGIIEGKQD